jgi:hypothetical protein
MRELESPVCSGISSPGSFLLWGFVEAISHAVEEDPSKALLNSCISSTIWSATSLVGIQKSRF